MRRAIADLVARGWLLHSGARGVYEFIPGSAAGPYPPGDPWLVLRAENAEHPGKFHVGANSAAWLLGYAQRSPDRHIVVTTSDVRVPRPLTTRYEVLRTDPAPASRVVDGLPVPTPSQLYAEVAQLSPRLHLDSARGWLTRLLKDTRPDELAEALRARTTATRARAGYLAELCGAADHAEAIARLGPIGRGPYFMRGRNNDSTFSSRWRVYDTARVS